MGRIVKGNISGGVGNLVFYESSGQLLVRTRPNFKVKQSEGTKRSAQIFAEATHYSCCLRAGLSPVTKLHKDRSLMYRMNTALLRWLGESGTDAALRKANIQALRGMELNEQAVFTRRWKMDIPVDFSDRERILLSMPAFTPVKDIKAPADTYKIGIELVAARHNANGSKTFDDGYGQSVSHTIELNYREDSFPAQQIILPLQTLPNDIVLVAIGINFLRNDYRKEIYEADKKWVNGKVVGVEYVV